MPALIVYLLKTIVCSGILYTFYRIAYYNRRSHEWNRFFLTGSVVISLVLPLIEVNVPVVSSNETSSIVQLLNVVATSKTEVEEATGNLKSSFDMSSILMIVYASVSCVFLFFLSKSLLRIFNIYKTHPKQRLHNINTVMTNEKDSPFSFLRIIFWHTAIDHATDTGKKIFEHEKVHVRQLHSIDRLLINLVLTVFWCNPFYWLIKKEMIVVHEFIADNSSIADRDPETFSEMLLLSAYPGRHFGVTSSFFNSSIKRRLTMLTTSNNFKNGSIGKWFLLPLLVVLIAGFTLRKNYTVKGPASPFVVMIDAGHGGERSGTTATDGTKEKDLNLSIAKKIQELNTDANIKILMTRQNDEDYEPQDRVAMATKAKADAFISIHINRDESGNSGFQLYMTKNSNQFADKSQVLGSLLSQELKKVYKIDGDLRKGRADKGIWVLDAPEVSYASVLIECGNMINSEDLAFIKSESNQEKVAGQILNAVKQYAANKTTYIRQQRPSAIEILVEKGNINIDLADNKIAKADLSELKKVSTKNIFAGDNYETNGSALVFVDGIYMSDKKDKTNHISAGANKKIILVSTKSADPLSMLRNELTVE